MGGLQGAVGGQAAALGAQQRLGAGGGLAPNLQQLGLGQAPGGRVGLPGQQFAGVNGEAGRRRAGRVCVCMSRVHGGCVVADRALVADACWLPLSGSCVCSAAGAAGTQQPACQGRPQPLLAPPPPPAGLAGVGRSGLGGGGVAGLNPALTQQGLANRNATVGGVGLPAGALGGYSANLAALQGRPGAAQAGMPGLSGLGGRLGGLSGLGAGERARAGRRRPPRQRPARRHALPCACRRRCAAPLLSPVLRSPASRSPLRLRHTC